MNIYEIKYNVEQTGSYFFDRATMRFFGDTLKNFDKIGRYSSLCDLQKKTS
jgi:hypothetical protein